MPEYTIGRHRGKFCIVWYEGGDRQRRSLGTDDANLAATRAREFWAQKERLSRPDRLTIEQIVHAYIKDRTPDVSLPQRFHDAWKALQPTFGHLYPDHIDKTLCRSYARERVAQGRSLGTVHVELGMIRAALRWAEREEWIERAPHVWMPQKPPPRDRYLTRQEITRLLDTCEMPHLRLFVLLALNTAARAGAILDLTWDRVDFGRGLIDLYDPQKARTRKGRAVVPMNDTLRAALEDARKGALSPYVIEWAGQKVGSIKKAFRAAVRRAGVEPCTPHTLRHTAAVLMAEGGVSMSVIAAFLGHTDSRTTERIYAKFSPDFLRSAARALEG